MSIFVLVHGGWHGAWCWAEVADRLQRAGHEVHAPTLRGLGGRSGELRSDLGVAAHVADVVTVLDALAPEPVVLVGHSYSGVVVRGAADRRAVQVERIVLVDGWVVPAGESILSLCPPHVQAEIRGAAEATGGDYVPPMPPGMLGLVTPGEIAAVYPRLTPHPLAGFTERVELTGAVDGVPCTAVVCTANPEPTPFALFAEQGRAAHQWRVVELATGHDAMITAPNQLAGVLLAGAPADPSAADAHRRDSDVPSR